MVRHFSRGTMRMLRLPAAPPVALRFPSNNGYLLDSIFFRSPRAHGVAPAAPGRWSTGFASTTPVLSIGGSQSDLSSSQGYPFRAFALLSDPGRISAPSLLRRFDSATAVRTAKAPALIIISRLNHTALAPAPYASCRHRCRLRNVRFRLVANLYRVGCSTHWVPVLCFRVLFSFPTLLFLTFWACLTRPDF